MKKFRIILTYTDNGTWNAEMLEDTGEQLAFSIGQPGETPEKVIEALFAYVRRCSFEQMLRIGLWNKCYG